jgi:hypothetical protein
VVLRLTLPHISTDAIVLHKSNLLCARISEYNAHQPAGGNKRTRNGELAMETQKPWKATAFPLTAALLLAAGCSGKTSNNSSSSASLPVWQPDAKLLDELGPMTTIDEYQVRPPKEYTFNPPPPNSSANLRAFYWAGKTREDKTGPHLLIRVASSPRGEAKERTLERHFDEMLEGFKRRRTNWTQTSPEHGQINGMAFIRAYWAGTDVDKQWKMHGFIYAGEGASVSILLSSQDVEPNHEQALKVAEASVLTFRKK